MNLAGALRRELILKAQQFATAEHLPHCLSYGADAVVCFPPFAAGTRHGNFMDATYKAIRANTAWSRRLDKVHTQGRRSLPCTDRGRWRELDACTSSDALLMNIFCYPRLLDHKSASLLGVDAGAPRCFGYKALVPLASGKFDRTEVDLRLGNLLIEAKLTEAHFQTAKKSALLAYRDFAAIFDCAGLPQTADQYFSYQLLRNVLAAHALDCSFCVLMDGRRTDLAEAWYAVMRCVRSAAFRTRLKILTWQELAQAARPKLRTFLAHKYGISIPDSCSLAS